MKCQNDEHKFLLVAEFQSFDIYQCTICGYESKRKPVVGIGFHVSRRNEKYRGKILGYTDKECNNCGRLRVELWENGDRICEKCKWNQDTKEYETADY